MNQHVKMVNQYLTEKFDQTQWDNKPEGRRLAYLKIYTAVTAGNFQRWLAGMLVYAQSPQAQNAARINMFDEMYDAHSLMLQEFSEDLCEYFHNYIPDDMRSKDVRGLVNIIDSHLSRDSFSREELGLYSTTLLMLFENASYVFIQHLKKLEQDIKGPDCKPHVYITAHGGEMEFEHADLMRNAFESEYQLVCADRAELCIMQAVSDVKMFTDVVFFSHM